MSVLQSVKDFLKGKKKRTEPQSPLTDAEKKKRDKNKFNVQVKMDQLKERKKKQARQIKDMFNES